MLVHTAWCELVRRLNVVFKGYLQLRVKTTLGMYVFRRFPTLSYCYLSADVTTKLYQFQQYRQYCSCKNHFESITNTIERFSLKHYLLRKTRNKLKYTLKTFNCYVRLEGVYAYLGLTSCPSS